MSLGKACAKGDFDKVTKLIKEGRNIEKQVKYSHRKWKVTDKPVRKCTPLIIASSEGHLDVARQLISAGANVHAKDGCSGIRKTALHYASEHGHRGVVLILLNNGSRSNEPDDCTMHTPLMRAIISGHEDIALELISRLHGDDLGVKDGEGHSALYYAHRKTFSKCTELLLSKMAEGDGGDREVSDARAWLKDYKEKALCRACKEGNLDKVKLLIKKGYNIEERVEYVHHRDTLSKCTSTDTLSKCTPLIVASSEGHVDIVRELLRAGADIHNKDSVLGRTALHYACNSGHILVVQLLLDRGSPLNEPDDYDNQTPLILAAYFGHKVIVSELLQRGADIHVKSKKHGRTALHLACAEGHLKCAQLLLDAGSRLNEPDDYDNQTPLILAAFFGHEEVVSELLQRGADIHVKSKKNGRTALHLACAEGHLKCAQLLVNVGSRLNEPDDDNWTPLILAAFFGHEEVASELLQRGADIHVKSKKNGRTALHMACLKGHLNCAQLLLDAGSRLNEPDDYDNWTPLILAALFGHEVIVSELLQRGANIHKKSKELGRTALHIACAEGHLKCAQLLLDAGSRLNEPDDYDNQTPIILAAFFGHEEVVSELLQRGADIHVKSKKNGRTALHIACAEGHLKCAQLLLDAGSRLNEPDDYDNQTPLILAAFFGHEEVVSELLQRGADIHVKSKKNGRTALHLACAEGHLKCAQLLVNVGSRLNEPDDDNWTPLILAAFFGHEEVASELLQRGADIHVKSKKNGRTALHMACLKGHLNCAQLLLDAGSRLNEPDDYDNWTPLILAALFGHEVIVSELLQRGANIHKKSKELGRTALHIACAEGHLKCAQLLLDAGSRLNEPDDYDNQTPLILAAFFGHEEVVSELLQRGADIHVKSKKNGRTALHLACAEGHLKCAQLLVNVGSRLNEPDDDNWTPLILAAFFGHEEVALELLQRGADIHVKSKKNGRTALHMACLKGHLNCAQLLLDAGSRLNEPDDYDNWTPLILAALFGHEVIVSELLQRGANIHKKSKELGRTALHIACAEGHLKCAQLLLDAGSRLNEPDDYDNQTPLILAAFFGHEEVVSELLQRGADIHVKSKKNGRTALHLACAEGHLKCAQLLVNVGSRLNEPDDDNWTPLILAAFFGHEEVALELLQRGADIHVKSKKNGRTALHMACLKGHLNCAQLLVNVGSRLNEPDDDNWTPLILAAFFGHEEVALELLQRGADIHVKSREHGRTALHLACLKGHLNCAQLLVNVGSRLNEPDDDNWTPLILAAFFGHEEVALELLQRGADIHVKSKEHGRTALHLACAEGHLKCAHLLVNVGSRLNEPDDDNWTPLILAAFFGHEEVASELLQRGADIHVKSKEHGRTALHLACEKGHLKCAQLLVNVGSRLNEPDDDNQTPLILAAFFGHEEVASELLQRGADIHVKSKKNGRTALHIACVEGHLKCAQLLLDAGSRLNEPDDYGNPPLHLVLKKYSAMQFLIARGCNVLAINREGFSALDLVAGFVPHGMSLENMKSYYPQIELLITAGCNLTAGNVHVGVKQMVQEASIPFKQIICVIGHARSGKSTLIAALRKEGTSTIGKIIKRLQKVDNITERTAGIEPVSFKSQKYGEVIFYDFAGQHDYHGPHQTFLEALVKRPGTTLTVLLIVKATGEEAVMLQQMTRWLQPLSWIISSESSIRVTVVGSFADQVKDFQEAKQKIERCCQSLQLLKRDILNIQYIIFTDSVLLDCRWIHSDGIENICRLINQSRPPANLHLLSENKPYNVHYVLHHLKSIQRKLVLSTDQFSKWLKKRKLHLHLTKEEVFMLCKDLSATGHVLLIENKQDLRKSWLILQLDKILHRMYGALFTKLTPSNRFGLVHVDLITKLLPEFEQDLIVSLLTSMDFSHEVDPLLFQSGILPPDQEEGWLFFPCLVTAKPTTYLPQEDSSSEYKYLCWQVNTPKTKFFSPHLLQTILLRLTTHQTVFKHDKPSRPEEVSLQVKEHCCILWYNGITWQTISGVDIVVQLFDNTIAQVIARIPHEVDPSVLVTCVSSVTADILKTINQLYPDLMPHLEAYIIDSTDYMELCTNPRCPNLHEKFLVSDITNILSSPEKDNRFCPSLANESELPRKTLIRDLFCGYVPSLDNVLQMNSHRTGDLMESSINLRLGPLHSKGPSKFGKPFDDKGL